MKLENEPAITSAQFLDDLRQRVSEARSLLLSPDMRCDDRLHAVQELQVWPEVVSTSFWETYSHNETFVVNQLDPIYQGLLEDVSTLRALCDEYGSCAQNSANCPVPLMCPGRISELKPAVCALQNAIELPQRKAAEAPAEIPEVAEVPAG